MIEIVLGPPGTGKTTTLLGEVEAELDRGVAPDRIGFVTFTRRGAEEAIERACARFKMERDALPWFRTLHSLCFRRLGMSRGDVFEGKKLQEFADYAKVKVTGRWSEDGTLTGFELGDRVLFMENLSRVRMQTLRQAFDEDDDDLPWDRVDQVGRALVEFKKNRGLLDFTDMLDVFVKSQDDLGLEVLVVDECQDLSALQWEVVNLLARGCRRVIVGGDDDQCIYRWAGADVSHMIHMEGSVRVLGRSWRVPVNIQKTALGLVSQIRDRREKKWSARRGVRGEIVRVREFGDVDIDQAWQKRSAVQPVLVLARNSYILDKQVAPELRRLGIVYERHGHPSISSTILGVVTTWERLRRGERVTVADARGVYDYMSSGKGFTRGNKKLPKWTNEEDEVALADLRKSGGLLREDPWHDALDRLPEDDVGYIRNALQRKEDLRGRPRVRLSTIHGAKGGEAHHVVLLREMARRTHAEMDRWPDDERRVWYVGATRAREKLTIVDSKTPLECPWL